MKARLIILSATVVTVTAALVPAAQASGRHL